MSADNLVYRWLHLSDLHVGCKGDPLWWQMLEDFQRSLKPWLSKVGSPDLLLLTGDLAWSGGAKDYERLDRFLESLLAALENETGVRPLVIPVAGNHDLQRPVPQKMSEYRVIDAYESAPDDDDVRYLRDQLWKKRKPGIIGKLFTHYTRWVERTILPQFTDRPGVGLHRSFFPGDLTVTLDLPGRFPLVVVGLNSAWTHYKSGDFTGRLLLPAEQFQAALPPPAANESPLDLFARYERALLLMHHPRTWLTIKSRKVLESLDDRFAACLFGHMHDPDAINISQAGGKARCFYQAPSLFGLEDYGTNNESRIFGYTFGQVARDGEVRIWPLRSTCRGDGAWSFDRDISFHWSPDDRNGVQIRAGDPRPSPASTSGSRPAAQPLLDITAYCEAVRDETKSIKLDGIATAAKALHHPIERLYTRLRTHTHGDEGAPGGLVDLANLLSKHRRLLIEGQPGSGKTTFLRLAASVLARDCLDEPCPDGPSWRAVYLGHGVARTVPVYLKLSSLATAPKGKGASRLVDHLVEKTEPLDGDTTETVRARREAWNRRLAAEEVTLLLDGLDEVGDPALRDHVLAALGDILRAWPKCQVVMTSRPIALDRLKDLKFAHASVAPFGPDEIRAYIERWVHALSEIDPDKVSGATEQAYAAGLFEAVRSRHELRRLATTPVMLTCLCVVYTHGGRIPEGRAELYRDTIRWLLAAREDQRERAGYDFEPRHPLAALALEMMGGDGHGKQREIDLTKAAEIVTPLLGRYFDTNDPPTLHESILKWLDFECQHSGVIEAVGHGQLQFKHLTFQEYLAAARLAASPNRGWWPIVRERLEDLQWRETIDLFPGCLLDKQRGGIEDGDFLVREIHQLWPESPPLLRAATITAITGRFLPAFRCAKYELPKDLAQRDEELRTEAQAIFTPLGAAKLDEALRIAAAEAIGVAGDERIAVRRFEANLLRVRGTDVRLGKYLVTVEEFARFVEERGYQQQEFWVDEEDGWSFRKRGDWESPGSWEQQLRTPNRPVVRVSWFEAIAYCEWLTAEHPHLRVRLPNETEWMSVASPDGRRYPWRGDAEPDDTRANFGKDTKGKPTPVGVYPAGDGEFGHCDLAGNVWEWTIDVDMERRIIKKQIREWGYSRVLCGGSSWKPAGGVAVEARGKVWSNSRLGDIGFRVAVERASRKR